MGACTPWLHTPKLNSLLIQNILIFAGEITGSLLVSGQQWWETGNRKSLGEQLKDVYRDSKIAPFPCPSPHPCAKLMEMWEKEGFVL